LKIIARDEFKTELEKMRLNLPAKRESSSNPFLGESNFTLKRILRGKRKKERMGRNLYEKKRGRKEKLLVESLCELITQVERELRT